MAVDVLIVEKHAFIRAVLRAMLADAAEIHSVKETDNLEDGLTQAQTHQPGAILLGLILNASDMHAAITQLHQAAPTASIVVLGLNDDPAYKPPPSPPEPAPTSSKTPSTPTSPPPSATPNHERRRHSRSVTHPSRDHSGPLFIHRDDIAQSEPACDPVCDFVVPDPPVD